MFCIVRVCTPYKFTVYSCSYSFIGLVHRGQYVKFPTITSMPLISSLICQTQVLYEVYEYCISTVLYIGAFITGAFIVRRTLAVLRVSGVVYTRLLRRRGVSCSNEQR